MGFFGKIKSALSKTSNKLDDGIKNIFTRTKLDDELLEELEDLLIISDMGVEVANEIVQELRDSKFDKDISPNEVKQFVADKITEILTPYAKPLKVGTHNPEIALVIGVNGSGKTTCIGKLANLLRMGGYKCLIAAADTFRAAAISQLEVWAKRARTSIYTDAEKTDPAAVAYKAIEQARNEQYEVLIIDTAGRLQNKSNLMAELSKINGVCKKFEADAPHHTILVLDATTGQNAVSQVEEFNKITNITGLIVTKLDGTAKGGVVVALAKKFGLPIYAIGVGEQIDDMQDFSASDFANSLVGL